MRGGDGVPQPAAGPDFCGMFSFFARFFTCFMVQTRAPTRPWPPSPVWQHSDEQHGADNEVHKSHTAPGSLTVRGKAVAVQATRAAPLLSNGQLDEQPDSTRGRMAFSGQSREPPA